MSTTVTILQYRGLPMMRGPEVLALQNRLAGLALLPREEVDGLFGPRTATALRAFQSRAGLPPTGMLDAETARHLTGQAPVPAAAAARVTTAAPAPVRPPGTIRAVPPEQLPNAKPRLIVLHWTGGNASASESDRQHYHFCIEQDGTIVWGRRSIADNDSTADGRYAIHTLNCNTAAIGVALCGMADAQESPFRPGRAPIRENQIPVLARLVAQLCQRYAIPVSRKTVLGHGEVQEVLGIRQNQKWDPLVLPWRRDLSKREVGDLLRAEVTRVLQGASAAQHGMQDEAPGIFPLFIGGAEVAGGGIVENGEDWVPLARLLAATGWKTDRADDLPGDGSEAGRGTVLITTAQLRARVDLRARTEGDLVDLADLVEQFDLALAIENDGTRRVTGTPGGDTAAVSGTTYLKVTVARGETLRVIARRLLGDAEAWTRILHTDGQPYDEAAARRIAAGTQVLVPSSGPAAALPDAGVAAGVAAAGGAGLDDLAEAISALARAGNRAAARTATPLLISACLAEGMTDASHLAYVLATAEHETDFGQPLVEKWGPSERQKGYQNRYGNIAPGDGHRYRGRGYVQLTFRANYRDYGAAIGLPLEDDPDLAAEPAVAARLIALGMSRMGFTKRKRVLATYGSGADFDFVNARKIINNDVDAKSPSRYGTLTYGNAIAGQARLYAQAIRQGLG